LEGQRDFNYRVHRSCGQQRSREEKRQPFKGIRVNQGVPVHMLATVIAEKEGGTEAAILLFFFDFFMEDGGGGLRIHRHEAEQRGTAMAWMEGAGLDGFSLGVTRKHFAVFGDDHHVGDSSVTLKEWTWKKETSLTVRCGIHLLGTTKPLPPREVMRIRRRSGRCRKHLFGGRGIEPW